MEWWWVVLAAVAVLIAKFVHDDLRAFPLWSRTKDRLRAEREARRARDQRLHELTHRDD